jgi:hypothetical protein
VNHCELTTALALLSAFASIRRSCLLLFCHARLRRSERAGIKLRRAGIQPVKPGVCLAPVMFVADDFAKVRRPSAATAPA